MAIDTSKVYGEADPVLEYDIISGTLVNGDQFSGALTRVPGEDVGSYDILQGTLTISDNYDIEFVEGVLNITKRQISIQAHAQTKYEGEDDPPLTYDIIDGELCFEDVLTLEREPGEEEGYYEIYLVETEVNKNYDITYASNYLQILPIE